MMKEDGTEYNGSIEIPCPMREQRKNRMVHISHQLVNGKTKLQQHYQGAIELWAEHLIENGQLIEHKQKGQVKKKTEDKNDTDDRLLATVHRVKKWLARVWRWTKCYTQYCYPGLRTVEYYRKMNEAQSRKKKSGNDPNRKHHGNNWDKPTNLKNGKPVASHDKYTSTTSVGQETQNFHQLIGDASQLFAISPNCENSLHQSNLGWFEYFTKRTSDIFETALSSENGQSSSIVTMRKWLCIVLVPVVLVLGAHYCLLWKQYKSLTGKLDRIKGDNSALAIKSKKLKKKLLSSENKNLPLATIRSRAEVLAEMTTLSERLIKSLEAINQLAFEKAELLNRLKLAKKQCNENQYYARVPQANKHMIS